jgi:hypothetical protein
MDSEPEFHCQLSIAHCQFSIHWCVPRLRRFEIGSNAIPPSRVGLLPTGASAPVRGNMAHRYDWNNFSKTK